MPEYVLVLSGKGGVGKTFVAINIAKRIAEKEGVAGIVDADYSNPTVYDMLNVEGEVEVDSSRRVIIPAKAEKLEVVSMPLLVGKKSVAMRGDMYGELMKDITLYTDWKSSHVVIDMSAGVGDEFLRAVDVLGDRLLGAIVVYIPAHIISAARIVDICKKYEVPVLGIIENMSGFHFKCKKCGEEYIADIFGKTEDIDLGAPFLGRIPFSFKVYEAVMSKKPFVEGEEFKALDLAAEKVLEAKPIGKSVVQKIKEKFKEIGREMLLDVLAFIIQTANTSIDLRGIASKYGFPGGNTIGLEITDYSMKKTKLVEYFRFENGVLKYVVNPKKVDVVIRIWDRALIWSILGYRPDTGEQYDLVDAFTMGKAEFYGVGTFRGLPTALHFFRNVWSEIKRTPAYTRTIKPILERLA